MGEDPFKIDPAEMLRQRTIRRTMQVLCKECLKKPKANGSSRCGDCSLLHKNKQKHFRATMMKVM